MAEKRNKIVLRFGIVYAIMIVLFLLVIVKIFQIQFVEGDKWIEAGSRNFKHNIPVKANTHPMIPRIIVVFFDFTSLNVIFLNYYFTF